MKRFSLISKANYKLKKKNNNFSFIKIRSLKSIFLTKKNFEAIRRFISRKFKKKVKYTIFKTTRKFPTFKKGQKSRMGKGKGKFNLWLWGLNLYQTVIELSFFKRKKILNFFLDKLKKKISINFFITYN